MRESVDEGVELHWRHGAVEIAPALRGSGIEIVAAEDHLHRPAASEESRQPLGAGAAREDAEGDLHLVHRGEAQSAVAHVARGDELATSAADAARDLGDRGLGHGA